MRPAICGPAPGSRWSSPTRAAPARRSARARSSSGPREIADYGELIDWVAAQPWSNGRVGVFGTSYDGQAAELVAGLGNPHVVAVAALFSPLDPYRELFYPGGCATSGRFARWMCESQVKDGVAGAVERLSELTGVPTEELSLPPPVKPVDGPDGSALLEAAIDEHQANVDMQKLLGRAPFSDDRLPGLDWQATTPAAARQTIEATGVPMLVRAGWLDAAFAAGALRRFATFANDQEVEIGPWGHGGGTYADTFRPGGTLAGDLLAPENQDRRLVEFFTRYVERAETPDGKSRLDFRHARARTNGGRSARGLQKAPACGPGTSLPQAGSHRSPGRRLTCATSSMPPRRPAPRTDGLRSTSAGARRTPIAGKRTRLLLTFTSEPLPVDLHVVGFPVVFLHLATSGSDGAVYAYLEDVAPTVR